MRERSKRHQLQRLLGELGEVLPRQAVGNTERLAQGWYAELVDGKTVFLGDTSLIAAVQIQKLIAAAE